MFNERLIKEIEKKLPPEFLSEYSLPEKILMVLDVWESMKQANEEQRKQILGLIKDLETTLNLLNLAEKELADSDLKNDINKWLEYYRNLAATID